MLKPMADPRKLSDVQWSSWYTRESAVNVAKEYNTADHDELFSREASTDDTANATVEWPEGSAVVAALN